MDFFIKKEAAKTGRGICILCFAAYVGAILPYSVSDSSLMTISIMRMALLCLFMDKPSSFSAIPDDSIAGP